MNVKEVRSRLIRGIRCLEEARDCMENAGLAADAAVIEESIDQALAELEMLGPEIEFKQGNTDENTRKDRYGA